MVSPKISIVVPVYNMSNAVQFLKRNLDSIVSQTFKDYEIVVSDDSDDDQLKIFCHKYQVRYVKNKGSKGMANNTNHAIENAKGKLIKILYQDDYFNTESSLEDINRYFVGYASWMVSGCAHSDGITQFNDHFPFYSESENTIGSPSVLTFKREVEERFDPEFHWVLDLDLYKRLYHNYGKPKILNKVNVVIGLHLGQKTYLLSDERKLLEYELLRRKYEQHPSATAKL
ncbi:glycosyltransferase family 2 protein [Pedobacter sp.]|jgi:glycosyltransferase involved in cell wall biosynthesis|uniref:glycosyltransferase family 2 protein n=1 Tax=Pedobacter sp. TaxID=1411316 RepID=UPI002B9DD205|nr:glycosyltransferase [Pedobacter sp.]HWW42106.1 glycosyltransferase [Pedobacter sp.]